MYGEESNNNNNNNNNNGISEKRKQKQEAGFAFLWTNFASNTTAHGFSQLIVSSHISIKFLWFLAIIGCQVLLYLQIYPLVIQYLQKPTKTNFYLQEEQSQSFPVITICNTNAIKDSEIENLKNSEQFHQEQTLLGRRKRNKRSTEEVNEEELKKKSTRVKRNAQPSGNNTGSRWKPPKYTDADDGDEEFEEDTENMEEYETKMKILSNLAAIAQAHGKKVFRYGYQLDELITDCKWLDYYNCQGPKWWKQIWHWRYGNCYAFNMYDPINNMTKIQKVRRTGPGQGLEVNLFLGQDEYFDSSLTETAGIVLHIGPQGSRIEPYLNGYSLAPNLAHQISLSKTRIKRSDPFKNGSCIPHTNIDLGSRSFSYRNITRYSMHACREICLAKQQIEKCGCSSYDLPSLTGNRTCSDDDLECANELLAQANEGKLSCLGNCKLPCDEISYEIQHSFLDYPIKKLKPDETNDGEELRLTISFKTLETKIIENVEYYFIENLLSDIGGQLGLFSGFSALTVVECVFFIGNAFIFLYMFVKWKMGFQIKNTVHDFKDEYK